MVVHAPPDEEVVSTGRILARYAEEGRRSAPATASLPCLAGWHDYSAGRRPRQHPIGPCRPPPMVRNSYQDGLDTRPERRWLPDIVTGRVAASCRVTWPL